MTAGNDLEFERFQETANHAPVMLWRISSNFEDDWVNMAWLKFTGTKIDEQSGFAWLAYVHPDDAERTAEHFDRAFEARKPAQVEFRLKGSDGSYRWFVDLGVPLFREGAFAGFIGSCIDIDDRKRAEILVEDLRAQLAASKR